MLKTLGQMAACLAVSMAAGLVQAAEVPLKVRVGGMRLVRFVDQANDIRPFNWPKGYTLSLIGTLPEAAIGLEAGQLDKAVADTGQNLLLEKKWDRRISFPKLSKDKKQVLFEAKMAAPDAAVRGLKELSGTLTCLTSKGLKHVDLGTIALKKGAQGAALGAKVVSVGPSKWQKGKQELQLKLEVPKASIQAIQVLDAQGQPLPVKRGGSMSSDNWVTLNLTHDQPFPASAKIKLTLHDQLKKHVMRFTLRQVTLTGEPLTK